MDFDYQAMRFWWEVALTVAVCGIYVYQWLLSRDRVTRSAIELAEERTRGFVGNIDHRVDSIHDRVTVVEQKMLSMPNHQAIAQLHKRLNTTNREMGELSGKLEATNHLLKVLHQDRLDKEAGR